MRRWGTKVAALERYLLDGHMQGPPEAMNSAYFRTSTGSRGFIGAEREKYRIPPEIRNVAGANTEFGARGHWPGRPL